MLQYKSLNHLLLFIVAASIFTMVACKKDNAGAGAPPSIKQIRAITPAPNDSVLTAAFPGQLVVIQGSNLASAMQISFYGFPASFNSGLFSDSNLVVRVPAIKWDSIPSGKVNTVEVVTPGGTATYTFNIKAPVPTIINVSNENAVAGTTITITGTNFYGITKVTFPGGILGTNLIATGTTQLTVTVPAGITTGDSLRVTGTYGTGVPRFVFDNYLLPKTGFLANFEDGNTYFGWGWWGGIKTNDATLFPNNNFNYLARYAPWGSTSSGQFVTNGWQTVTIPLTSFGSSAPTIATLTGGTNAASMQIMLYNDSATPLASFDAAVDNVRIVKIQ